MEIFIKINASCTGADYYNIIPYQIKGETPTEEELKDIEEAAKTEAFDSLSFDWGYNIITAEEAEASKEN